MDLSIETCRMRNGSFRIAALPCRCRTGPMEFQLEKGQLCVDVQSSVKEFKYFCITDWSLDLDLELGYL